MLIYELSEANEARMVVARLPRLERSEQRPSRRTKGLHSMR
jgi:hypothetical protein